MKMKESRKPTYSQQPDIDKQPDLEVKRVRRRDASKRMDSWGLSAESVENKYIQDKGARIQIIGSDVEALYPSLNAVEVAQIVYNCMMETGVKIKGINYQEACRMIALTSTEQECRLGPLKRVLPRRRFVH